MPKGKYDFSGYATKANVKCTDGRIILKDAFKDQDGAKIPLVYQHMHDSPSNVIGHGILENREDGVYVYAYMNDTQGGKDAKLAVQHGDLDSFSIWANSLIEKARVVSHGVIREVSLVLSGANPGAKIDNVAIQHDDGTITDLEDEAVIEFHEPIEIPKVEELPKATEPVIQHGDGGDKTVGDVFGTLNEEQKTAVYAIIGQILEDQGGEVEQSDLNSDEGDPDTMKHNVFDATRDDGRPHLSHEERGKFFAAVITEAKRNGGSFKTAALDIIHAGTFGIDNIDYLFPDAQTITSEPDFIARDMGWVSGVMSGTRHSPFSRIKSIHADITPDEARARGYITGNLKVEEVFALLKRETTPQTIYKKQKLDRDDIIDITDLDVVAWLKREMRFMLEEEIARAILVGDGRDPVADADDKIDETKIRPIWTDASVYAYRKQLPVAATVADLIDAFTSARSEYRGSGSPVLYIAPTVLTGMLLLKDLDGRRLYPTLAELAAVLRVSSIVEVPVMESLQVDGTPNYLLKGIVVNLRDYTIGADKGGQTSFFDDFDIDYNQYKYLLETRMSGALYVPKSAIIFEQADA